METASSGWIKYTGTTAEQSSTEKFWTCWVEGTTGGSHRKHLTPEDAMREAERLACQCGNQGKKVYVMAVVAFCIAPKPTPNWWNFDAQREPTRTDPFVY